jgi:PhzF family phenazine biosynthesis protein
VETARRCGLYATPRSDYREAMQRDGQRVVQVDAFTSAPFRGNPAAVCLLETWRDEAWLQAVAGEMNLSETAFLRRRSDGFDLRWFTPTTEVRLCGHATLASAHVLWEDGELAPSQEACFHTRSGLLLARREADWIGLDFPALPVAPGGVPAAVAAALGVQPLFSGMNGGGAQLVEVAHAEEVRRMTPDLRALAEVGPHGTIVTARADDERADFVSRFFAPALGVPEDPVTGSAHCTLGPYWAARLGKTEVIGFQASARGGTVRVRTAGAGVGPGRVHLVGQAVTVLRGTLV